MSSFKIDETTMRQIAQEFASTTIRKYVPGKGDEKKGPNDKPGAKIPTNTNNLKKSYRSKVENASGDSIGEFSIIAGNSTVQYARLRNFENKRNSHKTRGIEKTFNNDFKKIIEKNQTGIHKSVEIHIRSVWNKGGNK